MEVLTVYWHRRPSKFKTIDDECPNGAAPNLARSDVDAVVNARSPRRHRGRARVPSVADVSRPPTAASSAKTQARHHHQLER
jgi:hypothetical protein